MQVPSRYPDVAAPRAPSRARRAIHRSRSDNHERRQPLAHLPRVPGSREGAAWFVRTIPRAGQRPQHCPLKYRFCRLHKRGRLPGPRRSHYGHVIERSDCGRETHRPEWMIIIAIEQGQVQRHGERRGL